MNQATAATRAARVVRSVAADVVEVSKRRRLIRGIWSTDELDAHRTAFVMQGLDTSRYDANKILLWEHGIDPTRGRMPIANAVEYGVDKFRGRDIFTGVARFWADDPFAEGLFTRFASGELKGWSINGVPLKAGPPTREEIGRRPDWAQAEIIYRHVQVMEISAVAIPSNPSTLTLSVERALGLARRTPPKRPAIAVDPKAWMDVAVAYAEIHRLGDIERSLAGRRSMRSTPTGEIEAIGDDELALRIMRLKLECKYLYALNQVEEARRRRECQAYYEGLAALREREQAGGPGPGRRR